MYEPVKDTFTGSTFGADALFPGAIAWTDRMPRIRNIGDVKPHIREGEGINFFEHGDFIICRYTSSMPETFQTEIDLECRCMVFETASGALLSRTFHKFFNLGERQAFYDIDFAAGVYLEPKLDGTMIAAFVHRDQVIYHTRGGLSKHAESAGRLAGPGHEQLVRDAFARGYTPIFEHTGPTNRIVIIYEEDGLTLLALRHRLTGNYDRTLRDSLAAIHGVPVARTLGQIIESPSDLDDALTEISGRTDIEGVVLVTPDGHRLKVKTRDYLRRHQILANIEKEKYVYLCYLENVLDDTAAALGGERGRALTTFIAEITSRIRDVGEEISTYTREHAHLSPAERACAIKSDWSGILQSAAFAASGGGDPVARINQIMARQNSISEKREVLKTDIGLPTWKVDIQSLR